MTSWRLADDRSKFQPEEVSAVQAASRSEYRVELSRAETLAERCSIRCR